MATQHRRSKRSYRDEEDDVRGTTAVVVVAPRNISSSSAPTRTTAKQALWQIKLEQLAGHLALSSSSSHSSSSSASAAVGRERQVLLAVDGNANDPNPFGSVFSSIQRWKDTDAVWNGQLKEVNHTGQIVRSQLEKELEVVTATLQERSEQNFRLQVRITELRAAYRSAVRHLEEDLEAEAAERKHELSLLESELDRIQHQTQQLLEEQGLVMTRLQHVLALYQGCTGIKWYDDKKEVGDDDHPVEATMTPHGKADDKGPDGRVVWRGEVAIPSLHQLQEFAFDPSDRFQSANALWRTISGQSST